MAKDVNAPVIGGNVVDQEVNEGTANIAQNRPFLIAQFTNEETPTPEIVPELETMTAIFDYYKPQVDVCFADHQGGGVPETLQFQNLADFGEDGIIRQSKFLQSLTEEQKNLQAFLKIFKSNKLLQRTFEDKDAKGAFLSLLKKTIEELEAVD